MDLGNFSISLSVKDIGVSLGFYKNLGFSVFDGGHINKGFPDSEVMKWRMLENEAVKIGLFQGMFDNNILTFNPKDVLKIQERLKSENLHLIKEAKSSDNSKSVILSDPDGNQIMFDEHP